MLERVLVEKRDVEKYWRRGLEKSVGGESRGGVL